MFLLFVILVIAGLIVIALGAKESEKRLLHLSQYLRVPEFVTSFVIVGIAAILPEFVIGIVSAFQHASTFGLGVVWGSNVADLTLVIGVIVLLAGDLRLSESTLKYTKRFLLIAGLPVLFFIDGEISRLDGVFLLLAFLIYVVAMLWAKPIRRALDEKKVKMRFAIDIPILFGVLAVLLIGASVVTTSSQEISALLGLPLFIVGVVVAAGTCLPELSFGIDAARRMHGDLVFGPILGCVLADAMLTTGLIAVIEPIRPPHYAAVLSNGLLMFLSAMIVTVLFRKGRLGRKEGIILAMFYLVFLVIQFSIENLVR